MVPCPLNFFGSHASLCKGRREKKRSTGAKNPVWSKRIWHSTLKFLVKTIEMMECITRVFFFWGPSLPFPSSWKILACLALGLKSNLVASSIFYLCPPTANSPREDVLPPQFFFCHLVSTDHCGPSPMPLVISQHITQNERNAALLNVALNNNFT